MTIRDLLRDLIHHADDGRRLSDPVLIRVGHELRPITTAYSNGTLILIAGNPI